MISRVCRIANEMTKGMTNAITNAITEGIPDGMQRTKDI